MQKTFNGRNLRQAVGMREQQGLAQLAIPRPKAQALTLVTIDRDRALLERLDLLQHIRLGVAGCGLDRARVAIQVAQS